MRGCPPSLAMRGISHLYVYLFYFKTKIETDINFVVGPDDFPIALTSCTVSVPYFFLGGEDLCMHVAWCDGAMYLAGGLPMLLPCSVRCMGLVVGEGGRDRWIGRGIGREIGRLRRTTDAGTLVIQSSIGPPYWLIQHHRLYVTLRAKSFSNALVLLFIQQPSTNNQYLTPPNHQAESPRTHHRS